MSLLRFFNAAGQTFRGIGENELVRGSLGLMSANAPGQAAPVDQTGSFLKGMLSANALRQNRLLQEEQAKERERQEEQRVATQEFFQNVAKRPQMVADRQNQIAQMVAQRELTPFNAADMRATLPADMQARSMGDVGQQTPIHSEPFPDAIPTITQMALTSGVPSIQNAMLQNMMATPDTTAAYKDAVAIGLIPGTEEFNTYMTDRTIGSQKRFQDKAEIMQQERQFKLYQGAQDSAINAANMAGDLNPPAIFAALIAES